MTFLDHIQGMMDVELPEASLDVVYLSLVLSTALALSSEIPALRKPEVLKKYDHHELKNIIVDHCGEIDHFDEHVLGHSIRRWRKLLQIEGRKGGYGWTVRRDTGGRFKVKSADELGLPWIQQGDAYYLPQCFTELDKILKQPRAERILIIQNDLLNHLGLQSTIHSLDELFHGSNVRAWMKCCFSRFASIPFVEGAWRFEY